MSASRKKKTKPVKKKVPARKKAKVTKTRKVAKRAVAEKPKKPAPRAKKATEKEEVKKPYVKPEPVELGPSPEAIVATRHVDSESLKERAGRGFSFGELASAGVPLNVAKREMLSLDVRRRSVLDWNVELLKQWYKGAGEAPRKVEEPVAVAAVGRKK